MLAKATSSRFQFSLRAFMVSVTLACALLGTVASSALKQRRSVTSVLRLGGYVGYSRDVPDELPGKNILGLEQYEDRIFIDFFDHVDSVWLIARGSFGAPGTADAICEQLQELCDLEYLSFEGTNITDAGLERLHGLSHLRELTLRNTLVTKAAAHRFSQAVPTCRIIW